MGKSSAVSDLLQRMKSRFDLILAFIGSASCNPVLQFQMRKHWDDRFFFNQWDEALIERLLVQQEELKSRNFARRVLILLDDVVLGSKAEQQICNLAMRGAASLTYRSPNRCGALWTCCSFSPVPCRAT